MFSTLAATLAPAVRLVRRLGVSRSRVALAVGLLFMGGSLEGATVALLVPLLSMLTGSASSGAGFIGAFLDRLLGDFPASQRVLFLGLMIFVLVASKNALSFAGVSVAGALRSRAGIELRRQLLARTLRASPATMEAHTSGEIANVFIGDAWRVNRLLDLCVSLVHRSIIAASYTVAIFALSWRLTLATVVLGLGMAFASQWLGRRALRFGRSLTQASGQLARQVTEIVGGLRVVRTTATESKWEESFGRISQRYAEADLGASLSQSLMSGAIETISIAGAMGLTALAHILWLGAGALDVPSFLAFGFALIRLMPALNQVYVGQGFIMPLVGSIESVLRWLKLPAYPTKDFGTAKVPRLKHGIGFEGLSFSYPNGTSVISDLSFFIPVGETLAILGASGSGKSTLASLLLRLREPTAGKISIDGIDHWEFAPEDFHRAVAFVDQEAFMFNTTIAENLAAGLPDVTREQITEALRKVRLLDVIERLPEGIDTVLAERGATLSGGQRQRLAIARAIVRDPQLLVLDEPTSALDPETEREIVSVIDAASVGRTTIIITHRATTVLHATRRLELLPGGRATETALVEAKDLRVSIRNN